MTQISAEVIADSVASPSGIRLTTMLLRYPRVIHAEFMTHRQFSRNASSSRAIPVERLIQDVLDNPFIPLHWGANQKGMQAHEECNADVLLPYHFEEGEGATRDQAWLYARDKAVTVARAFAKAGYHKQVVNRLLEPFAHINVVVTATEWSNFFALRDHPDAEPHIRMLAQAMQGAMDKHRPRQLGFGEWHLPFITDEDKLNLSEPMRILVSIARCARTSYLTHERKTPVLDEDLKLAQRLLGSVPLHASPAEHQATPDDYVSFGPNGAFTWRHPRLHGNLRGWIQYRKTLLGECQ